MFTSRPRHFAWLALVLVILAGALLAAPDLKNSQSPEQYELNDQEPTVTCPNPLRMITSSKAYKRLKSRLNGDSKGERYQLRKIKKLMVSPVILIPGYGGSRLEGRHIRTNVMPHCEKVSDWSNIWIAFRRMLPHKVDCLLDNLKLEFDTSTNRTRNTEGVEIRVRQTYDNLTNIDHLTDYNLPKLDYFASLIYRLITKLGYKRGVNIKAAPYDFRKAPNELDEFFVKLKRDTEEMQRQSLAGQRITYICHSMGCNMMLYFLQRQTAEWKKCHVERLISLGAPWGGTMNAVRASLFGNNLGMPFFDETKMRVVQKSAPSTMFLFPKERVFHEKPLISFKDSGENLTANNFERFFDKIPDEIGKLIWLNTKDLLGSLEAPQVEVHCFYGNGFDTLASMEFKDDLNKSQEVKVWEDGDYTVSTRSSTFCQEWVKEQKAPVYVKSFHSGHMNLVRKVEVLREIESILKADTESGGVSLNAYFSPQKSNSEEKSSEVQEITIPPYFLSC